MAGFGFFKKLKEAYKKFQPWIHKIIPKVQETINTVKPIIQEVPKITKNEKVKNFFETTNGAIDLANEGLKLADDVIIKKKTVDDGINWINHNLTPRIKKL